MKKEKLTLCLVGWIAALSFANAASTPALDGMIRCAALEEPGARLACFDREIAPLAAARRSVPAPGPASAASISSGAAAVVQAPVQPPVAPPNAAPTRSRSLGEEQLSTDRRPAPQAEELTLSARITALKDAGSAHFVTLDNGQIWRHEDAALGSYLRVGESVTIARAAMGSYRLTRDAGQAKNWIRVSRVR